MLSSFIVYLSFIFGRLLRILSLEEIKQSRREIILSRNILLVLISLMFIPLANTPSLISILFFILFRKVNNQYIICFMFGIIAFLSYFSSFKIIILSLMSLLIILHSSLESFKPKNFAVQSILFFIPFSLMFVETFINQNLGIFIGLVIAFLLAQLKGP